MGGWNDAIIVTVNILVFIHPLNLLFTKSQPHDYSFVTLSKQSRPVVGPGARKPSVGEGIESRRPLVRSISLYITLLLTSSSFSMLYICPCTCGGVCINQLLLLLLLRHLADHAGCRTTKILESAVLLVKKMDSRTVGCSSSAFNLGW